MNEIILELVEYLRTKNALAEFNKRVDHAMLELQTGDMSTLSNYFSTQEVVLLQKAVRTVDDLQAIRAKLSQVEVFTVQLGFRPTAFFEYNLQQMISKQVKEPCVINIVTVNNLLGGAVVDYKGVYRDYSLKSAITVWRAQKK